MIFWGFVMWFVGGVAAIMSLLVSAQGIADKLEFFGWKYFSHLVNPSYLTTRKVVFAVGLLLVIVGLIVFSIGRAKVRRTGEQEKAGAGAIKFWRDAKGEYKKITWPSFKTVVKNTGITLIICALVAAFIIVVDLGLSGLVDLFLKLKK